MTPRRVGLAVNPTSGRGLGRAAGSRAAEVLRGAGLQVRLLTADSGPELVEATRGAVRDGLDALVVAGGDGMVNLGVNITAGTGLPLGVIPAGTGNDIAQALGLPVADPAAAARTVVEALAGAGPRAVDAARCVTAGQDVMWFAGVLGAGFDALVNERANGWSWPRGPIRYNLAIARELPLFRPRDYVLELDGQRWETAAMLVAIANGPSYGGGMRVCPDARLDDGLLDVLVVKPISRLEFVRVFPRVYAGTHVDHRRVVIHRARRVVVAAEGIVGYADGERLARLPLDCEAVPAALQVLAPATGQTEPGNPGPDDGFLRADGLPG
ncbi:MAG TPA: YegS/Rv2252/BmrU family lipid kinase [Kineosporiaceae bacterium]|nr:YegS/Rv2252/BmrU family lipid kinase [Kineosporiaceae bacterium]